EHVSFLPIVKAGVAAFDSMDDEDIATLFDAVDSTPGAEAERLLEELKQKILAQPTIGPETAETLERHNTEYDKAL
ncbi:MAG: hypothetical protein H7Z41_05630, partial [Cytophagales bacterium]|nr:hypothetical protein [Armatimonadota bacterium]